MRYEPVKILAEVYAVPLSELASLLGIKMISAERIHEHRKQELDKAPPPTPLAHTQLLARDIKTILALFACGMLGLLVGHLIWTGYLIGLFCTAVGAFLYLLPNTIVRLPAHWEDIVVRDLLQIDNEIVRASAARTMLALKPYNSGGRFKLIKSELRQNAGILDPIIGVWDSLNDRGDTIYLAYYNNETSEVYIP